jgi:hypothetical protein
MVSKQLLKQCCIRRKPWTYPRYIMTVQNTVYFPWINLYRFHSCKALVGGFPSQLMFGCRLHALLLTRSVNIQLALCGALGVTGRRLVAVAGRLVVEVGWRRCCLEDCRECCSSLRLSMGRAVHWSPMKPESWSSWFPLKSLPTFSCRCYIATYGTCRANTRKHCSQQYMLRLLVTMESPVYRAVARIPICVSVTWSPVFPTCGRFPWEALTLFLKHHVFPVLVSAVLWCSQRSVCRNENGDNCSFHMTPNTENTKQGKTECREFTANCTT